MPERESRLRTFLTQPNGDFVCHAGQHAFRKGRIPLLHLPSLDDVRGARCDQRLGDVPYFRNLAQIQEIVFRGISEIASGSVDGVICIAPADPLNHTQAFNYTHAFIEVVYTSGMVFGRGKLNQLSSGDRREIRDDYFRQLNLANNLTLPVIPPLGATNDKVLVSGLSPLYADQIPGKRYPRWAPVFCFSLLSWNVFNTTRESQPALTARIVATTFSRILHPYEPILPYILPDHPEFQKASALKFGASVIQMLNQVCGEGVVLVDERAFMQAVSVGAYTLMARGVIHAREEIQTPRGLAALFRLLGETKCLDLQRAERIITDLEQLGDSSGGRCPFPHS